MADALEPDAATLATLRAELDEARRERDAAVAALAFERRRIVGLLESAPAFIAITRGPDHVIEFANGAFHEVSGHRPVLGKAMLDAFPEIADQGFIPLLDRVYRTGEPFHARRITGRVIEHPGAEPVERSASLRYHP